MTECACCSSYVFERPNDSTFHTQHFVRGSVCPTPVHTQTRPRPLLLQMFGLANVNDASLTTPVVLVAHGRTVLTMRLSKVGTCSGPVG